MRTFSLGQFVRTSYLVVLVLLSGLLVNLVYAESDVTAKSSPADIVRSAAAQGKLAYKLTELEEFKALLGPPAEEKDKKSGGMEVLFLRYPDVSAIFGRMRDFSAPFTLMEVNVGGRGVDIGEGRQITLRNENDLKKFDAFWGFADVSLANVDLKGHKELLEKMPFDSRTKWPEPNKMPEGFDPARLLEEGKNPGLGVRGLHKQGIDGRGVGIAVIDQPLLKDHIEYADHIVRYEAIDVRDDMPPQMHGPPVASIAVGKTCGVAPAAALSYFAVPMWKQDNAPYCEVIDRIIKLNESSNITEQIRVVSISTGMFPRQANFDRWKQALEKAEQHGILVVTCSQDWLSYGMLARVPNSEPDDPNSYQSGIYGVRRGALLVPAGNRTTASHHGPDIYTFWTESGLSWAAPYLAGLGVLAYQVNPEIKPKKIIELWQQTAVQTEAGLVVNPVGFIEAVRKTSLRK